MRQVRHFIQAVLVVLALTAPVVAQDATALKAPGVIALMRHALAPGTNDPAGFEINDCATQRNLDDRGRVQAVRIGEFLKANGVGFDEIWTSRWCRTQDTAELVAMGPAEIKKPLNSFFAGRGDRAAQTAATLKLIAALPPDRRVLLVTHQVNITALTGTGVSSGEIIVTRRRADTTLEVTGRLLISP